jgi:hypothetical protein
VLKIDRSYGLEVFVNISGALTLKQDQQQYGEEPKMIVLSKREAKLLRTMLGKVISKMDADNAEADGGL